MFIFLSCFHCSAGKAGKIDATISVSHVARMQRNKFRFSLDGRFPLPDRGSEEGNRGSLDNLRMEAGEAKRVQTVCRSSILKATAHNENVYDGENKIIPSPQPLASLTSRFRKNEYLFSLASFMFLSQVD